MVAEESLLVVDSLAGYIGRHASSDRVDSVEVLHCT